MAKVFSNWPAVWRLITPSRALRLWAHVYALRAEILRVERLKTWPYDETEPALSQEKLDAALVARTKQIENVKRLVRRYIDT